jgi:hypothetical protein
LSPISIPASGHMTVSARQIRPVLLSFLALFLAAAVLSAAYKARPWTVRAREGYPASLTSEGVTIAAEPLYTDALAAQVFDKSDIVTRGIMPLAVIIFNSNDFPIEVEEKSIELQQEGSRIRSLDPLSAVQIIYASKPTRNAPIIVSPIPLPKITIMKSHAEACQDFKEKFLSPVKRVERNATVGGFLFMPAREPGSLAADLMGARLYIPNLCRSDSGHSLLYFEVEIRPAIEAAVRK